jgi:hypothetical protein
MTAPAPAPPASLASGIIGARMMRVTLLDACGRPVYGPRSQVTTKGFVSVEIEPETEEGEDYKQKNAAGELCLNDRGPDSISWYNLTIDFCNVDPDLFLMLQRTWKRNTDASRQTTTGWRQGEMVSSVLGYALELWPKASGTGAGQACLVDEGTQDPTFVPGWYMLMSWVIASAPDALTLEDAPTSFKQKGRTRAGSLWGRGPYNVVRDLAGEPAPLLDPIDPGFDVPAWSFVTSGDPDHIYVDQVTVAPPLAVTGAQPLWNPAAVAPTITVTADVADPRTAELTVTNFAAIGNSGTVNWGDGNTEFVPSSSAGLVDHTYAATYDDQEVTVTFTAGNGAAPDTATFTPSAP